VDAEGACRVCSPVDEAARWRGGKLEAAHIIPRSQVRPGAGEDPRNIVPLCGPHHYHYDTGDLDILPYLSREEQAYAVSLVGLVGAWRRLTGEREPMGVRDV